MSTAPPPSDIAESPSTDEVCCGGDLHCGSESPSASPQGGNLREGCPPPLNWQDVLTAFREQTEQWEIRTPAGQIGGRIWGSGPTLLMLNGLGGSQELFALCSYLLKADCRCVLFDYPTGWRVTWPRLADSLSQIIQELSGSNGCYLFGTSFGAALAMEAALREKSEVRGLLLHAAFARLPLTIFERAAAAMLRWIPGHARSIPLWQSLQQRSHRLWFPPIDSSRWSFYLDDAGNSPIAELARRFGMLRQFDVRSNAATLTMPTLLMQVEGEGEMQARCRDELAGLLPNARTEFLHSTGLLPFLTHPHRIAKLTREFISTVNPTPI